MVGKRRFSIEALRHRITWNEVNRAHLLGLIELARGEDLEAGGLSVKPSTTGDLTTRLVDRHQAQGAAILRARCDLVVAGVPLVQTVLDAYGGGCGFVAATNDGARVSGGDEIGRLSGPAGILLQAERVLLNFLQHLSGVASLTADYVSALGESDTVLLDTRKTTPGFRVLEKYAVACGGGYNHRIGLFDRVMLKDNHLAVCGAAGESLAETVRHARETYPETIVEVEVDHIDQVPSVVEAGADVVMLDNFSVGEIRDALALIGGRAFTEASGGITLERLPELARLGLDFISTGATVHQSTWKDIGLDWKTK